MLHRNRSRVISVEESDTFIKRHLVDVIDIKVLEEAPAGSGLAAAGREALSRMTFAPAEKAGKAVPFCGMEQPFEVKFRD